MKKNIYIIIIKDINIGAPSFEVFTDEIKARDYYYYRITNWLNFYAKEGSRVIEERMDLKSKYIGMETDTEGIEMFFEKREVEF